MKLGRYLLIVLILTIFGYYANDIQVEKDVVVVKGDTYAVFFDSMSWRDARMLKIYLRSNYKETPPLYPGVYRFEKSLTYKDFLTTISTPPKPITAKVTLLEGWSSWDFDVALAKRGYALSGAYRSYVTDKAVIDSLRTQYSFLPVDIPSLEGFLYPDTYNVDVNKPNVVEQLVGLQLKNFDTKVWSRYQSLFTQLDTILQRDGFSFKMGPYSVVKLASIIENEEKNNNNKPIIAGLFLNRIDANMQLGADITLCYGLNITYDLCTSSFIIDHLYDKQNPYNTRQQMGLPPGPISNPTAESILAVLHYVKSNYLYYLHDNRGKIYYGSSLQEHNTNKKRYLD